jgi:hypothetical protein
LNSKSREWKYTSIKKRAEREREREQYMHIEVEEGDRRGLEGREEGIRQGKYKMGYNAQHSRV